MGRLIEEQAVIECLTNTAKYYEREDADEWTKGIHYGLLHGLDNILDNVPTVEAIPKAEIRKLLRDTAEKVSDSMLDIVKEDYIPKSQYEKRLKADMVAMLTELQLEIEEIRTDEPIYNGHGICGWEGKWAEDIIQECSKIIQEKINSLKEAKDGLHT